VYDLIAALMYYAPTPEVPTEPDMQHPKIQSLIGSNARRNIEIGLIEQLLDDPDCELTSMDMEYWGPMHDKLREKLLAAQQTVPSEAVAWMVYTDDGQSAYVTDNPVDVKPTQRALPLFTESPPQRKPLLADEVDKIADSMAGHDRYTFTAAIEAAHGITGESA
jgi:hypothetical protein